MSKEVKRYTLWMVSESGCELNPYQEPDADGNWVTAADYDAILAERDALAKDAERYRWLRMADWWNSPLCVIRDPKQQAKPGTDCPSRDRLDEAIDAAQQGAQP